MGSLYTQSSVGSSYIWVTHIQPCVCKVEFLGIVSHGQNFEKTFKNNHKSLQTGFVDYLETLG